jgi:hypothetical protein
MMRQYRRHALIRKLMPHFASRIISYILFWCRFGQLIQFIIMNKIVNSAIRRQEDMIPSKMYWNNFFELEALVTCISFSFHPIDPITSPSSLTKMLVYVQAVDGIWYLFNRSINTSSKAKLAVWELCTHWFDEDFFVNFSIVVWWEKGRRVRLRNALLIYINAAVGRRRNIA